MSKPLANPVSFTFKTNSESHPISSPALPPSCSSGLFWELPDWSPCLLLCPSVVSSQHSSPVIIFRWKLYHFQKLRLALSKNQSPSRPSSLSAVPSAAREPHWPVTPAHKEVPGSWPLCSLLFLPGITQLQASSVSSSTTVLLSSHPRPPPPLPPPCVSPWHLLSPHVPTPISFLKMLGMVFSKCLWNEVGI